MMLMMLMMVMMLMLLISGSICGADSRGIAVANMSWDRIPLFAHVRTANFTSTDYHLMRSTLRMVTVQGTYFDGMTSEDQTGYVRDRLQTPYTTIPVLSYRNVYYSEPVDGSTVELKTHSDWMLRGSDGKVLNPDGKYVYNMSNSDVPNFYGSVIGDLVSKGLADGAFGDLGCGRQPPWLSSANQHAFAQGQWKAQSESQLASNPGVYVSNCPYVPHPPEGNPSFWPARVHGVMFESWCSDFLTGVGGPGSAMWCRDELFAMLTGPAAWKNNSIVQARYYLNGHNQADPRFGAIAFLVIGFPGAFFGASTDWNWDNDWQKQSQAGWATQPLGVPESPRMLDSHGCGWARNFSSGASVFLNLCSAKGHPMQAHATWADGSTWPANLGSNGARAILQNHIEVNDRIPPHSIPLYVQMRPRQHNEACIDGFESEILDVNYHKLCVSHRQRSP